MRKLLPQPTVTLGCVAGLGVILITSTSGAQPASGATPDSTNASAEEASITFAHLGGIRDWRATDRDTLYVQGRNRQWYRAELLGPCIGLDFATRIGFSFEPSGSFDRFSSVVVDGHECPLKSLVESELPANGKGGSSSEGGSETVKAGAARGGTSARAKGSDGQSGQPSSEPARIPFANLGGIEDWQAVDQDTLYIEGRNRQWYRAELFGSCPGLQFETSIGFVIEPTGSFDRFSSIVVDGRECHLKSLTESERPAARG